MLDHDFSGAIGRDRHEKTRDGHSAVGGGSRKEGLEIGGDPQVDAFVTLARRGGHGGTSFNPRIARTGTSGMIPSRIG